MSQWIKFNDIIIVQFCIDIRTLVIVDQKEDRILKPVIPRASGTSSTITNKSFTLLYNRYGREATTSLQIISSICCRRYEKFKFNKRKVSLFF